MGAIYTLLTINMCLADVDAILTKEIRVLLPRVWNGFGFLRPRWQTVVKTQEFPENEVEISLTRGRKIFGPIESPPLLLDRDSNPYLSRVRATALTN